MHRPNRTNSIIAGVVSGLVMLSGSMMPWATLRSLPVSNPGDSDVTATLALATSALFAYWGFLRRGPSVLFASILMASLVLLMVVVDGSNLLPSAEDFEPPLSDSGGAGLGLYITGLGAVGAIVTAVVALSLEVRSKLRRWDVFADSSRTPSP